MRGRSVGSTGDVSIRKERLQMVLYARDESRALYKVFVWLTCFPNLSSGVF